MEQQEKQAIRSQRLRRAVTCMKRKEREGEEEGEEDSEEEIPSPSKSKRGKAASKSQKKGGEGEREEERSAAGGGFLGSAVVVERPLTPLKDVSKTSQELLSEKITQTTKNTPQRASRSRSSSSSGDDSDSGGEIAMVTARSVFEGSRRGHAAKSTRGRGRRRGSMRGKRGGKKQ